MIEAPSKSDLNGGSILQKRKRSPYLAKELAPSSMTLRKRAKRSEEETMQPELAMNQN